MAKKVMIVFGTRPEAIKMTPLVKEFQKYPKDFKTIVCVTAQHREMLDQVLNLFDIVPNYDLNLMKEDQDLFDISSSIILGMKNILKSENPEIVFVHGDTITSAIVALSSFFMKIPVAHIEAGLRTNDIYNPFPEEMNRQLTSRIASYHFAPTESAKNNLLNENIKPEKIWVTGNTVIDVLHLVQNKINSDKNIKNEIVQTIAKKGYSINRLDSGKRLVLITGHRRENLGDGFVSICEAIRELSELFPNVDFVYPVHLNPSVQKPVNEILSHSKNQNVFLLSPLDYLPFIYLMEKSYLLLTDSGGIQEEAPSFCKPVIIMREISERPEVIEAGIAKLVGTDKEKIVFETSLLLNNQKEYETRIASINPYGDGHSSGRVVDFVSSFLK